MFTLIDGFTFLVTRDDGSLAPEDGLYHKDTRHFTGLDLSCDLVDLEFVGRDLASSSRSISFYSGADPEVNTIPNLGTPAGQADLLIRREQLVDEATGYYEKLTAQNHASVPVDGTLLAEFDVDFADVFEVRGFEADLDRQVDTRSGENTILYEYVFPDGDGDGARRTTAVGVSGAFEQLSKGRVEIPFELEPQETTTSIIHAEPDGSLPATVDEAELRTVRDAKRPQPVATHVLGETSLGDHRYDQILDQAVTDLGALTSRELGSIPLTGIPWFATIFGRDLLITGFQTLPVAPAISRDSLRYLAAKQGKRTDPERDERRGKIFHEIRHGELALRGRIPHTPYYGSIDATPLWIILLDETVRWTGDEALARDLHDPCNRAIEWIDQAVERIGDDPFLYYEATDTGGLDHKAWRDSSMSVQFRDGTVADPPLASVEVQGYVYDAYTRAARLRRDVWDEANGADRLLERADAIRDRFNEEFWLPDRRFYGAAKTLDGRIVDSHTSNVGHCLWSGIVDPSRAEAVVDRLVSEEMYSGWGIRTMGTDAAGYSPLSYHAGSVWPHDNSIIALGLARYGFHNDAETIARDVFEAITATDRHQVPELFSGIDTTVTPIPYKSACTPQAWAAGAPFALIRAVFDLGPTEDGTIGRGHEPETFSPTIADRLEEAWEDGTVMAGSESPRR